MRQRWLNAPTITFVVAVMIMAASFIVPLYQASGSYAPRAVSGVLDLSDWSCASSQTLALDGEWLFYWDELLTPESFVQGAGGKAPSAIMPVPGNWDAHAIDGEQLSKNGYATYRLKVLMPCEEGTFGLKTSNIRASNRIFVNGTEVGNSGQPATSPSTIVHRNTPYTAYFALNGSRELDILVQVASFKSYNTGIVHSISFGTQQAIAWQSESYVLIDAAIAAGFFFIAIYFLLLYFQRRSRELLYFSLFCLSSMLFGITHYERLLMKMLPWLDVMPQLIIENLSTLGVIGFFSRYAYYLLPSIYPRRVLRVIDAVLSVCALLVVFTPATYYAPYILALVPLAGGVMSINVYYLIRATMRKLEGSPYLLLSAVCLVVLMLNTILNTLWTVDGHFFLPLSQPLLVISQALYMSLTYTSAFRTNQQLTEQLAHVNRLKDEFLANTSHEFRSPLNGIINISQSLIDDRTGRVREGAREDLQLIRDIGVRLSVLVQDILDYSRIKNRDLTVRIGNVSLHAVTRTVLELGGHLAQDKPVTLVNSVMPGLIVRADENRLHQILRNLVENAIKYTDAGMIEVLAEQTGGRVRITVSDTGVGIPEESYEAIFQPYEQLDGDIGRGTGLGLSIARQLVELLGGEIAVSSKLGEGTRISFTLPAAANRPEGGGTVEPVRDAMRPPLSFLERSQTDAVLTGSGPYSLLLVDDDDLNLLTIGRSLQSQFGRAVAVTSGHEALQQLERGERFDLCIIDVMMPGMSGLELCRRIRESYSMLELPVLLLTASSRKEDLQAGYAAGGNDFLYKPYDTLELISRVQSLAGLKHAATRLVQQELLLLQAQIKPHFLFNALNTILSLSYTDHVKARKVLQQFSVYLRYSFDFRDHSGLLTLSREIELLHAYVEIEKARFGELLHVVFEVEPEALYQMIPPLMLQPIVENAIHHGLMNQENGGTVTITVQVGDGIYIAVADDGGGFPDDGLHWRERQPSGTGIGLHNIDRRLLGLYGQGLRITSEPGEGTVVSFHIPHRG